MDKQELKAWLRINESINIQLPNEIFIDFDNNIFKNYNHKCFAYSYYYLVAYIYRNTLYGNIDIENYSMKNISNIFVSNISKISYITKKGGVLDNLGYTETTTNYPISFYFEQGVLRFSYVKDYRKDNGSGDNTLEIIGHSPRLSIKEPTMCLKRFDNEDFTGTYYEFQNTHSIDINKFVQIVSDEELGHVGFFIYGYLKMMCDKFPSGFQISNSALSDVVGCTERTLTNYTQRLETIGLVRSERKLVDNKLLEKIYYIR